jgi:hypothetical protein
VGQIEAISAREQAIAIVPRKVMILLHHAPVSFFYIREGESLGVEDRLVIE